VVVIIVKFVNFDK